MPEVITFEISINTITFCVTALYLIIFILFLTIDNVFTRDHKVINIIIYLFLGLIYAVPPVSLVAGWILSSQALVTAGITTSIIFLIACLKP